MVVRRALKERAFLCETETELPERAEHTGEADVGRRPRRADFDDVARFEVTPRCGDPELFRCVGKGPQVFDGHAGHLGRGVVRLVGGELAVHLADRFGQQRQVAAAGHLAFAGLRQIDQFDGEFEVCDLDQRRPGSGDLVQTLHRRQRQLDAGCIAAGEIGRPDEPGRGAGRDGEPRSVEFSLFFDPRRVSHIADLPGVAGTLFVGKTNNFGY